MNKKVVKTQIADRLMSLSKGQILFVFDPILMEPVGCRFDQINPDGWIRARFATSTTLTSALTDGWFSSPSCKFFCGFYNCIDSQIRRLKATKRLYKNTG